MSQTNSPGLVDASHWTFVAAAMAKALRSRAGGARPDESPIPRGIYRAARDFFRMVNEALESEVPTNPVGSAANYAIAARAVRVSAGTAPKTEEEYTRLLRRYSELLERLDPMQSNPPLSTEDLEDLAGFFKQIAEEGEAKAHEKYRSFEHRSRRRRD